MSRSNLILLGVVAVLFGVFLATRQRTDRTPKDELLFKDFDKTKADRIMISGGWHGEGWDIELTRADGKWTLTSAGGFAAKDEEADKFLDAVYNLRRENLIGSSAKLQKETRTNDQLGRLVTVYAGKNVLASFRVGKRPERSWDTTFVRAANEKRIYRTRTLLSKDRDKNVDELEHGASASGYSWHDQIDSTRHWIDSRVWDLGEATVESLALERPDMNALLEKRGEDKWVAKLKGDAKFQPGDVDAANNLTNQLNNLHHVGVAGRFRDVARACGLDQPLATLELTLKKKVVETPKDEEGTDGDKPEDGDGKKDGDKEKEKDKKPVEKYVEFKRWVTVGRKFKRPTGIDDETGELQFEDVYAVHLKATDDEIENLDDYVYFLDSYRVGPLLEKTFADLAQKPSEDDEKGPGDGDGENDGEDSGGADKDPAPGKEDPGKEDDDGGEPGKKEEEEPGKKPGKPGDGSKKEDDGAGG